MEMNKPIFKAEDLKHLPFNYRHVMKYDDAELPPNDDDNNEPKWFNFVAVKALQTDQHKVVNIYKPISRLFANYDTKDKTI